MSNPGTHNLKDVFINWKGFQKDLWDRVKDWAALNRVVFLQRKSEMAYGQKSYSLYIYSHSCKHLVG